MTFLTKFNEMLASIFWRAVYELSQIKEIWLGVVDLSFWDKKLVKSKSFLIKIFFF